MSGMQGAGPIGMDAPQGERVAAGSGTAPAEPSAGTVPPFEPTEPTEPTQTTPPPEQTAPEPAPVPGPAPVAPGPAVTRSRLGGLWVALISGTVVLVLLLVFILMNGQHVQINFYGAHWNLPLGVALLMASAIGILLVVVPGAGRILQLRAAARRARRRAIRQAAAAGPPVV
jgi:uncharacterized integral membrane protein